MDADAAERDRALIDLAGPHHEISMCVIFARRS
jgi:hypothetical protein